MSGVDARDRDADVGIAPNEADEGGRHRGREVALQVLYAIDLGEVPSAAEEETDDPATASLRAFDQVTEHFEVPGAAVAFAKRVVAGTAGKLSALDERIAQHSRNWRVDRMAAVDRNVLRLATWELLELDTPVAVVIDEAVDLARRFGSDTSPAFVNGILDAVARDVRAA